MTNQNNFKTIMSCFFAFMLLVLVAGCGGGNGTDPSGTDTGGTDTGGTDTGGTPPTPIDENYIDIEARVGGIFPVRVGGEVRLKGSSSITKPLSYDWSFSYKPEGSTAELVGATTETPSFIADVWGSYMVQLVVSAEGITSQRAIQFAVATVDPERATGRAIHASLADPDNTGLSSNCGNCHNSSVNPGKSADHLATSDSCQTCHTPLGFDNILYVDHQEVFGSCSECHNGDIAFGKSKFHSATDAECDDCHTTTHFLELEADGGYDHSTISNLCSSCHNGNVATGKTPTPPHPDTDSECLYCHSTVGFEDYYVDHEGPLVNGPGITCDSCHNGNTAIGPDGGHPLTNVDCNTCHNIRTFSLDGVFNHGLLDSLVQSCESCHKENNSINAPAKSAAVPTHSIVTGDCGLCHNTENFADAFIDHSSPEVTEVRCDSCHGDNATGKSVNHMVTTEDCRTCHTPGTFATGTYDHVGVVDNCESCHNDVISVGKLLNHLPTTEDCSVCHNTTDFSEATFNHSGIDTSNCAICHNGVISTGESLNHVPTNPALDCSDCHTINNFDSFAGITYNHLGIDDNPYNCSSCHASGIATGKSEKHIPTQQECNECHLPSSFASFLGATYDHTNLTQGCEGCHNGEFSTNTLTVEGKTTGHLPTSQDCHVCHNTTAFKPASNFAHVGITGNCQSCHNGSAEFVLIGAIAATDTATHQNTNEDCGTCHNTVDFADAFVDHSGPEVVGKRCDSCHGVSATGMHETHVVTTEDCNVCHVPGTFATAVFNHTGITDNCSSCHDGQAAIATVKNSGHVETIQDCSVCHTPEVFAGAKFNHQGIVNNCASCHNGTTATGKTHYHIPTNDDCSQCHQTTGFKPATFDHAGIVNNCRSCHDGAFAEGKSTTHVPTNQDCSVCHTITSFVGAGYSHTGIVDNCESCHDTGIATGKNNDHLTTNLDCHLCHTTATFKGGSWSHDASSAGNCDSCHTANGGATSKPSDHLSTNVQCDECHTTNSWAPLSFSHDPQGNYPGDHRRDPGCSGCHGNTISSTFAWPSSQYKPFCAACHASDFRSESDHKGGKSGTVEQNKDCSNGGRGCHKVSDREWD